MKRTKRIAALCLLGLPVLLVAESMSHVAFAQLVPPASNTADGLLSLPTDPLPNTPGNKLILNPAPAAQPKAQASEASAPENVPPTNADEDGNPLPNPLDIVSDTDTNGFKPSYGSWPYSIMYPSTEITNLKNILALYERKGFIVEQATEPEQNPQEVAEKSIEDLYSKLQSRPLPPNLVYPSFKLRSILYRNPNDWSVWLNNRHITNENNKKDFELSVVNITKDYVEFTWIPANPELLSAILQLRLLPEASRPPVSATPKHRKVVTSNPEGWLDKSTSQVHFILRPNQVFYSETFEVFEGVPDLLVGSVNRAIQLETEPNSEPTASSGELDDIIKGLKDQLETVESMNKKISGEGTPAETGKAEPSATPKAAQQTKALRKLGIQ